MNQKGYFVLGLDVGTNSLGWALLDLVSQKIIAASVAVFAAGKNKTPTGKEESRNAVRRLKRGMRRQFFRRRQRKAALLEALQILGWIEKDLPKQGKAWEKWLALCPYQLRAEALERKLTLEELARVFYNLALKRGFKSNRKALSEEEGSKKEEDTETKKTTKKAKSDKKEDAKPSMEEMLGATRKALAEGGFQTLGQYLYSLQKIESPQAAGLKPKIRGNHRAERKLYQEEFDRIWQAQVGFFAAQEIDLNQHSRFEDVIEKVVAGRFQNEVRSKGLAYLFKEYLVFFQRPLKSSRHLIGKCTLFPTKKRAAMSHPLYQKFRIWDKLAHIRLTGAGMQNEPLSMDDRHKIVQKLETVEKQTIKQILKLIDKSDYQTNFKETDIVMGNKTALKMRKIFDPPKPAAKNAKNRKERNQLFGIVPQSEEADFYQSWDSFSEEEQIEIWNAIENIAQDNEWLAEYARKKWQLSEERIQILKKTHFEAPYGRLSVKALRQILPYMENEGMDFSNACAAIGLSHSEGIGAQNQDFLGEVPNLRNPLVQRSLSVIKKVVNEIIKKYGKPNEIHIELARELKLPLQAREKIDKQNRDRAAEHERIKDTLQNDFKIISPSRQDIIKYKLWKECDETCPYTGDKIRKSELFSHTYEVEHIIPYSRSLDDSFGNKTLCRTDFNRKKANLTPYEMKEKGLIKAPEYEAMLERVRNFKPFSAKKFQRFTKNITDFTEGFENRQLTDTAYIGTETRKYMLQIAEKETDVILTNGGTTAELRRLWGFNSILKDEETDEKKRDDHRHHLIDAIVIALTNRSLIKRLADENQVSDKLKALLSTKDQDKRFSYPKGWESLRHEVKEVAENALVYHHFRKRKRGTLHDDSLYGRAYLPFSGKPKEDEKGQPYYTIRKKVEALTIPELSKIADKTIRLMVFQKLEEGGISKEVLDNLKEIDKRENTLRKKLKKESPPNYEERAEPKTTMERIKEVLQNLSLPSKNPYFQSVPIKKLRIQNPENTFVFVKGRKAYVAPNGNHHLCIIEKADGKRRAEMITRFAANTRKGETFAPPPLAKGEKLLMTLMLNELLLVESPALSLEGLDLETANKQLLNQHLYRVKKMSGVTITMRHYLSAKDDSTVFSKSSNELKARKVRISPTGEISWA
ncbi:type II CRISPR RNA-guided endonuclease Cas9 [Hugenholtzia roseola]|uniref:type II CRISPR RNA-guided endonuclease Cas9 n=1 Tax=Hugenholtzia roseola TaxID=1002 RepID=UPI0003F6F7F1|nr:type II CRISPR RNA-guided endonuclease Cas9 [Hugenholtzia roseola]